MKLLNDKEDRGRTVIPRKEKKSRGHIKRNTTQGIGHTKDGVGREGVTQGNKRRDGAWEQEGGAKDGHVSGSVAEVRTAPGTHCDI